MRLAAVIRSTMAAWSRPLGSSGSLTGAQESYDPGRSCESATGHRLAARRDRETHPSRAGGVYASWKIRSRSRT